MDDIGNLNSTSSRELGQQIGDLTHQSNANVAGQYGSGFTEARGLLNPATNPGQGLAYGDQATSDAIRSRSNQAYTRKEHDIKTDILKNASHDHLAALQVASHAAGEEVEQNRQKELLRWKIDQQNKKARGAVLGTVLGITGGVVAGIYTGGAGAGAGYAAGQGIGQAVGSS